MNRTDFLPGGFVLVTPSGQYKIVDAVSSDDQVLTYLAEDAEGNVVELREFFPRYEAVRSASGGITAVGYAASEFNRMLNEFVGRSREAIIGPDGGSDNVRRVMDVVSVNGTAYCILEHVVGTTLETLVASEGPLTESRMLDLMMPIISGMEAVHAMGKVHRAISPTTIVVGNAGDGRERAVLLSLVDSDTSVYNSIEQYAHSNNITAASDIYSLAATMVYALGATRLPMAAEMTPERLGALLDSCGVSAQLRPVMVRAMAIRAAERPANATDLKNLIMEATGRSDVPAIPAMPADAFVTMAPSEPEKFVEPTPDMPPIPASEPDYTVPVYSEPPIPPMPVEAAQAPVAPVAQPMVFQDVPASAEVPPVVPMAGGPGAPVTPVSSYPGAYNGNVNAGNRYQSAPNRYEEPDPMADRRSSHTIVYIIIGVVLAAALGLAGYFGVKYFMDQKSAKDREMVEISDSEWDDKFGAESGKEGSSAGSTDYDSPSAGYGSGSNTGSGVTSQGRYDMSFHQLVPGSKVKSLSTAGLTFTFDRDGEWTNPYYVDSLHDREWTFDGPRRTSESYTMSDGTRGTMYYTWEGSDLVRMDDHTRGYVVIRTYDGSGLCLESTTLYDDNRPSKTIYYSDYKTDSHGNWVSRRNSRGTTETRRISYYD